MNDNKLGGHCCARCPGGGKPAPGGGVGEINVYASMMAERLGFKALYLSGGGVANASFGLPDLGMTTLNDVLEEVLRVTYATRLPLLFGKCRANLGYRLSAARSEEIMALCLDLRRLEKMSVHEFMGMLVV